MTPSRRHRLGKEPDLVLAEEVRAAVREERRCIGLRHWGGWARTTNLLVNSQALCLLSYTPLKTAATLGRIAAVSFF